MASPADESAAPLVSELDEQIAALETELKEGQAKLTALKRRRAQIVATATSARKRHEEALARAERVCLRWDALGRGEVAVQQLQSEEHLSRRTIYRLIKVSMDRFTAESQAEEAAAAALDLPDFSNVDIHTWR